MLPLGRRKIKNPEAAAQTPRDYLTIGLDKCVATGLSGGY